jgi:hypothetical protein
MLDALLAGQTEPALLADLARGRVKAKRAQLEEALVGTVKAHHRFRLSEQLVLIDTLDEAMARVSQEIEQRLDPSPEPNAGAQQPAEENQDQLPEPPLAQAAPEAQGPPAPSLSWAQAIVLLCSIAGISRRAAEGILAELGIHMSRFPSSGHLASWAGMVRCITRLNIPGAARKNSKGGSWVNGLPHVERSWGTVACH